MKVLVVYRYAIAIILLAFCILIFPAWGANTYELPKLFRGGTLEAAPLLPASGIAFACIFPLGVLAMFSSLLPFRLLRIGSITGIGCCLVLLAHFLMPHSWKADEKLDPFYQKLWEKDQIAANHGNAFEHIEYDKKDNDRIIFYIKGFGITAGESAFTIISFLPCAAIIGEILLRRKVGKN